MGTTVFERRRPAASVIANSLEGTAHSVFWRDDLPPELVPDRPRLTGRHRADLVIVGAGSPACGPRSSPRSALPTPASSWSRRSASAGRPPDATAASARRASPTAMRTAWPAGRRRCRSSTGSGSRISTRSRRPPTRPLGRGAQIFLKHSQDPLCHAPTHTRSKRTSSHAKCTLVSVASDRPRDEGSSRRPSGLHRLWLSTAVTLRPGVGARATTSVVFVALQGTRSASHRTRTACGHARRVWPS